MCVLPPLVARRGQADAMNERGVSTLLFKVVSVVQSDWFE